MHTTTPASHTPSDFRDPGNSWYGDEMDENEVWDGETTLRSTVGAAAC